MFLEFTDEQLELRESARAALARECPPTRVRDLADAGPGDGGGLDAALTWLGWPALTIGLDQGGLGRGFVELAIVLEELGRAAAPGTFGPTTTQFVPVVRELGTEPQAHRFLAGVASGEVTGTLALHEGGRWDPQTVMSTAERDGEGWLLQGQKRQVLGAPGVGEVAVAARRPSGGLGIFVVPAAELTFKPVPWLDTTRSIANVELNNVWVPDARLLGDADADASRGLSRALDEAMVGLALDALGVCSALFDTSLDIARDRGIGGRATEHALAEMVVAIELARALAYQAVGAVAERRDRPGHVASAAKAAIGECQRLVTRHSLEIAGTAGEHAGVRLRAYRAKADELLLGSGADHRRIVADHTLSSRKPRTLDLAGALRT